MGKLFDTLCGKRLCIHFGGKQIKEINDQDAAVNVERLAISVTSPDPLSVVLRHPTALAYV